MLDPRFKVVLEGRAAWVYFVMIFYFFVVCGEVERQSNNNNNDHNTTKENKGLVVGRWTCSSSYSQGANADDIFNLHTFHGASSERGKGKANGEDGKLYAKLLQHLGGTVVFCALVCVFCDHMDV